MNAAGTPSDPHAQESVSETIADSLSLRDVESQKTVYSGRIWDVVQDTFRLEAGGAPITRDYIDHPGAVAVMVLNEKSQILLINQYRHPVQMKLWEIPAGLLDVDGEDYVVGAQRELAEEADLEASDWKLLVDYFTSPGSSSEAIRIYLASGLSEVPEADRHQRTEEEAEIAFSWVSIDDAVAGVLEGRIHNPSAVVGILAVAAAAKDGFASLRPADSPWVEHPKNR